MNVKPVNTICFIILLITGLCRYSIAQSGFYVPATGKIFFNGDTATIFSNVINMGKLGVGQKAVVNFSGKIWENDPQSLITDESNNGEGVTGIGGLVRFRSDSTRQQLNGGYNSASRSGPMFASFELQNKLGLELVNSSSKIRHGLHLQNGLFYLQNNILVVGDGGPGTISGYDSSRYIVTGNAPGMGLLIRESIKAGDEIVTFPIGPRDYAYTPAAVKTSSALGDDYYATVFDGVKTNVTSGNNIIDEGVNTTWQIGKRFRPSQDEVEIYLQHPQDREGSIFAANRNSSYVSFFNGNQWDSTQSSVTVPAGYLTSGPPIATSYVNNRNFSGIFPASGYFTKFTHKSVVALPRTNLVFNAYRVNALRVFTYWATKPEVNIKYFVVQRRLDNETTFSNRDTVLSKAPGGFSSSLLRYAIDDDNAHTSYSYYRLMMVDYNGNISYSDIVVVAGTDNKLLIKIWPNPSPTGRFYVGINTPLVVKSIVVWDVLGQKLQQVQVLNRDVIPMYIARPGSYYIGFYAEGGRVLESRKLIVTGY
ncbi:MAG: T9SS type A sorting domain-containing protein [Chitinophagaceae bacterium]